MARIIFSEKALDIFKREGVTLPNIMLVNDFLTACRQSAAQPVSIDDDLTDSDLLTVGAFIDPEYIGGGEPEDVSEGFPESHRYDQESVGEPEGTESTTEAETVTPEAREEVKTTTTKKRPATRSRKAKN